MSSLKGTGACATLSKFSRALLRVFCAWAGEPEALMNGSMKEEINEESHDNVKDNTVTGGRGWCVACARGKTATNEEKDQPWTARCLHHFDQPRSMSKIGTDAQHSDNQLRCGSVLHGELAADCKQSLVLSTTTDNIITDGRGNSSGERTDLLRLSLTSLVAAE